MCNDPKHHGWVKVGVGRAVWMDFCLLEQEPVPETPAIHTFGGTFSSGRSRFVRHDGSTDIGDPGVIADLNVPDVRKWCEVHGHQWGRDSAGNEGPAVFGNRKQYEQMLRETGYSERDHASSKRADNQKDLRKKYPKLKIPSMKDLDRLPVGVSSGDAPSVQVLSSPRPRRGK